MCDENFPRLVSSVALQNLSNSGISSHSIGNDLTICFLFSCSLPVESGSYVVSSMKGLLPTHREAGAGAKFLSKLISFLSKQIPFLSKQSLDLLIQVNINYIN